MINKKKYKDRLALQQAKRVITAALILGMVLSFLQIAYDFIIEKRAMSTSIIQVIKMIEKSSSLAAYHLDPDHAQHVLQDLFEYPSICKAEISNNFNQVLAKKERPLTIGPLNWISTLIFGSEVKYQFPLIHLSNLPVGTLSISIDTYHTTKRMVSKASIILLTGILRNFILAILLTATFYYSLTRPLLRLVRNISQINPDKPDETILKAPPAHQNNEIGELVEAFRDLLKGLAHSLRERNIAVKKMARSEQKYRSIFENSTDGIFQTTTSGRFNTANPAMAKILGFQSPHELLDAITDIRKVLYVNSQDRDKLIKLVENNGFAKNFITWLYRKDNSKIPVTVNMHAVKNEEGKTLYFEGNVEDISEKKQAEKLRIEKEAAEAANKAKSQFLANMSHEIRTPMNGIIGNSTLALETDLNTEQKDYIQAIKISAAHLLSVINDILDFSKIEAGHLELELAHFKIRETIETAIETLAVKAHEKGLELINRIDTDVPDHLIGDQVRLRQVIVNLLSNAVKFTEVGEVVLNCKTKVLRDQKITLHIEIKDTGIGINPDKQKIIFNSFQQADGSTTRKFGGTGLGLTISKQLVELMGGRLWVESNCRSGSCFHFIVQFNLPKNYSVLQPFNISEDIKDKRILAVDDNHTNLKLLQNMFIDWGVNHGLASNGHRALAELKKAEKNNTPYDLIIIDGQMPQMDGFELSQKIKSDSCWPDVIVVMLTSMGLNHGVEKCRNLGLAGYLVKPIKQSDLFDVLTRILSRHPQLEKEEIKDASIGENTAKNGYNKQKGLNILLAEDNLINQKMAVNILEKMGHHVCVADNGESAIETLHSEPVQIDIILMDIQMPKMDGLAATRKIRKDQSKGRQIPIIAMTANAMKGDREKCLNAGMNDYIAKPFDPQQLAKLLRQWDMRQHIE